MDAEENLRRCETERGTPMGELLRRYWHPVAAAAELEEPGTKPVRLLGEDLVLYKDLSGRYGLLERHCPHRRADLSYGYVEDCGLRCSYHGWLFDEQGTCLEQPFEETGTARSRFKEHTPAGAYPVEEHAGLLWAYLGPSPAPLVPNYEPFTWCNCFRQIVIADIPCNWLQCQENSIDPVHFEWLHSNWSLRLAGKRGPYSPKHVQIGFDEFELGFVYRRIREDTDESNPLWTIGRACIMPNLFVPAHFEWRVPVDDYNTLSIVWTYDRVPRDREPYVQEQVPYWYAPIKDERSGRWITSHVINQDTVAWVGQGAISDRENEHLGRSDQGVRLFRRQLERDLAAVAEGRDPKGVIRDPEQNRALHIPNILRDVVQQGWTRQQFLEQLDQRAQYRQFGDYYPFYAGQPEEIRKQFREAMGL